MKTPQTCSSLFILFLVLYKLCQINIVSTTTITKTTTTTTTTINNNHNNNHYHYYHYYKNSKPIAKNNCTLKFYLNLGIKPDFCHKKPSISLHTTYNPIMLVGTHQWIHLNCDCCARPKQVKQYAIDQVQYEKHKSQNQTQNKPNINPHKSQPLLSSSSSSSSMGILLFKINSFNGHVITLSKSKKIHGISYLPTCNLGSNCISLYLPAEPPEVYQYIGNNNNNNNNETNENAQSLWSLHQNPGFYMHAENLGQTRIEASLIWLNITKFMHKWNESALSTIGQQSMKELNNQPLEFITNPTGNQINKNYPLMHIDMLSVAEAKLVLPKAVGPNQTSVSQGVQGPDNHAHTSYTHLDVTVILKSQNFYTVSDYSAVVIVFLLALSVGCCDDPVYIKIQLIKQPQTILIGVFIQMFIIPLLSFGIGVCFALDTNQSFGLLVVSLVPEGGLAYLLTYLVNGDKQLSAALSFISSLTNLGVAPLWIWIFGWHWFTRPVHISKTVGWLTINAFAQCLGTCMRGFKPNLALGILTWITRPLLLLAAILLITLGVYINYYAFTEATKNLIFALLTLITCGFVVGWVAGLIGRQDASVCRTLGTSSILFNGLLCMPLLRTSLHAPEGDLAATVSFWVILFTPIPLAYNATINILQHWFLDFQQKRQKKKKENFMASVLGSKNSELGATAIAAVAVAVAVVTPAITIGNRSNKYSNSSNKMKQTDMDKMNQCQSTNENENVTLMKTNPKYDIRTKNNMEHEYSSDNLEDKFSKSKSGSENSVEHRDQHQSNRPYIAAASYAPHRAWAKRASWFKDPTAYIEQEPVIIKPNSSENKIIHLGEESGLVHSPGSQQKYQHHRHNHEHDQNQSNVKRHSGHKMEYTSGPYTNL